MPVNPIERALSILLLLGRRRLLPATDLAGRWEKCPNNPLIPVTPGGFGYDGPELLRLGDTWHLYVRTPKSNYTQRFRLEARDAAAK